MKAIEKAKTKLSGVLDGADAVAPLMTRRGIVYRARLSGLDHASASRACRVLKGGCLVLAAE